MQLKTSLSLLAWLRRYVGIGCIGFSFLSANASVAQEAIPSTIEGTSSRDARQKAVQEIPYSSLTPAAVAKLRPILEDPTIFRRMPRQTIVCDDEMFRFLVRYPEVLVEIWDIMGMTRVTTQRTGPYTFKGDDGAGTTCIAELVYGNEKIHVYHGNGEYEGTMFTRRLEGRSIVIIRSSAGVSQDGQPTVTATMDVFLKLDNIGADLIAKSISPLVVRTADYNYIETLRFVSQLSLAAERNPQGVDQLSKRMTKVNSDVKQKFVNVAIEAALRRARDNSEAQATISSAPVIIGKSTDPNPKSR